MPHVDDPPRPPRPGRVRAPAPGAAGIALLLVAAAGLAPPVARAQPTCAPVETWAERCASERVAIEVRRCIPGGAVLTATVGGEPAGDVEIARRREGAFRQVGALGLSPVGEYADFRDAPAPVREAFEAIVRCAEREPDLELRGEVAPPPASEEEPPLLAGALLLALLAGALALWRRRPTPRQLARALAPPALASLGGALLRAGIADPAFVHQNGHGPHWISHALCVPSRYGPGYAELFGGALPLLGDEPSLAVFRAQALLGALATGAVWVLARGAGARPPLAAAATAAVAFEPALARLWQSESYFGAITSLLLLAGALIAGGGRRRRPTDPVFLGTVAAAGLLVAQAARVHPVAWVPSALLPLILVVAPGRLRTVLLRGAVATLGVGALAAAFALELIGEIAGGEVGAKWLPDLFGTIPTPRLVGGLAVALGGAALMAVGARRPARGLLRGAAFFVVALVASWTHLIGAVGPIIVAAYYLLFLPPLLATGLAGLAGMLRGGRARRGAALALLGLAGLWAAERAAGLLTLPTDALEQAWVREQRSALPADANVAFLGVAHRRVLHLPLYGACVQGTPRAEQLALDEPLPDLAGLAGTPIWYRSSLCATPEGGPRCAAIEGRWELTPIATTELPARESMEGLGYEGPSVPVGLYALEER